ncbi:MAG TPA: AAA family ATPase, partial [Kofleriaceae bacterium]
MRHPWRPRHRTPALETCAGPVAVRETGRHRSAGRAPRDLLRHKLATPAPGTPAGDTILAQSSLVAASTMNTADQLGPCPVDAWLRIAIGLADEVAELHARGLLHRDICPAHVVVGDTIALIARDRETSSPPYMAPERTGRMSRPIDARADLYSVGMTLYELAAGTLPFHATDPMEWAHCHLARQPAPLTALPSLHSKIVMKLLAKAADDRYQTAAGLAADLRAVAAGEEPTLLGRSDVPARFTIPERLYGRDQEVERLRAAFARVAERGDREVVMVAGYSGIGKSSVIRELHKDGHGLFASGKHDQQQIGIPYAPFAQAFRSLVPAAPPELLREALAVNGALVVGLIPELEAIVGSLPPVPEVPPADAQRRFQDVFRRFVAVFARAERPLVLFLDDLQWFDEASLDLLMHLATVPGLRHLLLVGAYRDNEVSPDHPLRRRLDEIGADLLALSPLSRDDLARLV